MRKNTIWPVLSLLLMNYKQITRILLQKLVQVLMARLPGILLLLFEDRECSHEHRERGRDANVWDKVAMRAYQKWVNRGCPRDSDKQDWAEAEAELRAEMARTSGSQPQQRK